MFEPLKKVFIHPTRQIKLRFRYKLPNLQVKVLIFFLEMKFIQPNQLTTYDFLYSIMEELLTPFLLIQNQTVTWEAVSIIYPQKKTSKYDLLKLPLFNVKGVIPGSELQERFRTLNVSIRFEGRPMPSNIKVYGINLEKDDDIDKLITNCANIYTNLYTIKNTGITYKVVFLGTQKTTKTYKDVLRPIMAFANIN